MRILIIGAVAAGTTAGTNARRRDGKSDIVIYERDRYISYSGCGMPYFLSRTITTAEEITPRGPDFFKEKFNIDVKIRHEVTRIDTDKKTLEIKDLENGKIFYDRYDKLIISTGAKAVVPSIEIEDHSNVFTLRNVNDMKRIDSFIEENKPETAVILGSGFIGLEMCESFSKRGIKVTLIEKLHQLLPALDADMSEIVQEYIENKGIRAITGALVKRIQGGSVEYSAEENGSVKTDMILISAGIKPEVTLAVEAGIRTGITGAIEVDGHMLTNIPDIYSCGDCTEQTSLVTGSPIYRPLGSTANKTGAVAGDNAAGGKSMFSGILGTGIFKLFDLAVAQTGLTSREARSMGIETAELVHTKPDRPQNMGGRDMVIKAIAKKDDGRLLGAQIIGYEGVDKRMDVFACALTFKAHAGDLTHLDLAYAPPFSTAKDPVNLTGTMLESKLGTL